MIRIFKKNRLPLIFLLLILFFTVSCDDEIFGPRSLQGTWRVTETSDDFGQQSFLAGIEYFPGDSTRILIDNFSNLGLGFEVQANVSGLSITIPAQSVRDSNRNNFYITGSGTATSNLRRINWNYRIDGDEYSAVFEKQ